MPSRRSNDDEFPLLSGLGLYAAEILGDGNCLFNALSDQLYGHQAAHSEIRERTVDYMRDHASEFKAFISVNPGGGVRRNPKRKNVGAYSTPYNQQVPTEEEIEQTFQRHLDTMAKGGTWGDNVEVQAFARAYDVTVKIYHRDFAYYVTPFQDDQKRLIVHIAYHTWEHYSSIRNLDGPHDGPPEVRERAISPETEAAQKKKLAATPYAQDWQIDVVMKSLPFLTDKSTIRKTLEECKGSIDNAVSRLLDEDSGNQSSAQESSSIEREPDSDDDDIYGPNKSRSRQTGLPAKHDSFTSASRDSSASRNIIKPKGHKKRAGSKLASQECPQESKVPQFYSPDSQSSQVDSQQTDSFTFSQATVAIPDSDAESSQESDADPIAAPPSPKPTSAPRQGPVRIRLTMPKPPPEMEEAAASMHTGKSTQKQIGPQGRKISARDKKDMKKQAQKAARRERQQQQAAGQSTATRTLPIITKSNPTSPSLDAGIKVLYV
ncbi:Ovarian tumor otubain [Lasiodiplodia theobromae]|uniref:OTU domain-containing protein 3 n=1 Tax=Lasiodiplodia theobromae TaxID=45133 RepID=A0A5N5DTT5_9PEZI|nr:Otu-like cysteine protease family protein [Lasiodiplodia theobromae]KAB2581395.1 OTU domain-containing protein 3 [Lasiodiplodia theobromae]KAF4541675.1 Otu-like cysteine protease family protein [Lasiodiplodia theobromae]KAF9629688.1 Ovarian tumor otubain [Lasiodiplodia theobromae]